MAAGIDGISKGLLGAFILFVIGGVLTTLFTGKILFSNPNPILHNYGMFNLFIVIIVLLIIGSLLILIVILGSFGVLKDSSNVRLATIALLFVIFISLMVIGGWSLYINRTGRLKNSIIEEIDEFKGVPKESSPRFERIDYLNRRFGCCSFFNSMDEAQTSDNIPESCCVNADCSAVLENFGSKYSQNNCAKKYFDFKGQLVMTISLISLIASGCVMLALIIYIIVHKRRAHAGYAGVSRG